MRDFTDQPNPDSDVLSAAPGQVDDDAGDVQARWAASAASAASRAYAAAYGREIPDTSTRMRWRLEPRVAVTAAIVLVLLGVGAWWSTGSAPALPPHVDATPEPSAVTTDEGAPGVAQEPVVGDESSSAAALVAPIVVHVSGAVAQPGLVTIDEGARVADAVDKAGGVVAGADVAAVNLARLARDGEQIHIPLEGEAPAPGGADAPVNLNTADATALETLPGVGPVLAQRIIADRDANGPFTSLDDLARVSGVGEAMVAGLTELAHT